MNLNGDKFENKRPNSNVTYIKQVTKLGLTKLIMYRIDTSIVFQDALIIYKKVYLLFCVYVNLSGMNKK